MAVISLSINLAPLVAHTDRRGVAFLTGDADLDAWKEYQVIADTSLGKRVRHKMKLWLALQPDMKGKYHRYKGLAEKYRRCFAFIDLDEKIRFYGFTCHPDPNDSRFELVVLAIHAIKKENETDISELNRVVVWQDHMATKVALTKLYGKSQREAD